MKNSNVLMNRIICSFWVFTIIAVSTLKVTYSDPTGIGRESIASDSSLMENAR